MKFTSAPLLMAIATTIANAEVGPSATVFLSPDALNFASTTVESVLNQLPQLQHINIPDQELTELGVEIAVTSISCDSFHIRDISLEAVPGTVAEVKANASDFGMSCQAHYKYREKHWPHKPNGEGDMTFTVNKSTAALNLQLFITADGHPEAKIMTGSCAIELNLDFIHFEGKFIVSDDRAKKLIQNQVVKLVCPGINSLVTRTINPLLARLKLTDIALPLPKPFDGSSVDVGLLGAFVTDDNLLEVGVGAVIHTTGEADDSGSSPCELPASIDLGGRMAGVVVCPYVLETAVWTFQKSGALIITLDKSNAPAAIPFKLETATFKKLVPELYTTYPDQEMSLNLSIVDALKVDIAANTGAVATTVIEIDWNVIQADAATVNAFTISCPAQIDFKLGVGEVDGNKLSINGKVSKISCVATQKSSTIGDLTTDEIKHINGLLTAALSIGALPQINAALAAGVPLPNIPMTTIKNAEVVDFDGYILIAGDVEADIVIPPPAAVLEVNYNLFCINDVVAYIADLKQAITDYKSRIEGKTLAGVLVDVQAVLAAVKECGGFTILDQSGCIQDVVGAVEDLEITIHDYQTGDQGSTTLEDVLTDIMAVLAAVTDCKNLDSLLLLELE